MLGFEHLYDIVKRSGRLDDILEICHRFPWQFSWGMLIHVISDTCKTKTLTCFSSMLRQRRLKEFGKMENMGGMMEGLGGIDPSQARLCTNVCPCVSFFLW